MKRRMRKSQGFGDDVAKVAAMLGLDRAADKIAKAAGLKDCGCAKRQQTLNNIFPYKNNNPEDESK